MTELELPTRDEAVARAERIRTGITLWATLQDDLATAYHRRDWTVLGYHSWDAYLTGEFGTALPRIDRTERRELVVNLRAEGLSTRAIGAALGVDHRTVGHDLAATGEFSPLADANASMSSVTGVNGRTYAAHRPPITAEELDELRPERQPAPPSPEPEPVPSSSASSAPASVRRKPITDQAEDAGWTIRKAVERVGRILGDDRYARNKEQVTLSLRGHLLFVREQVTAALDQFDH